MKNDKTASNLGFRQRQAPEVCLKTKGNIRHRALTMRNLV